MGLTGPVQPNDIVMRASEIGTTIPGVASLAMKTARKGAQRGVQGIYQLPGGQEPTPEFMNVSQQNLNNQTQQMTDMLNSMAPQDERLAYINEEEAGILKLLGGSGNMTPQGIPSFEPDLPPGQRKGFKKYNPATDGPPEGLGQSEIYRAYMDQLPEDNPARQAYFTTGFVSLPQTSTADKDEETSEDVGNTGSGTGSNNSTISDRFERGGPETPRPPMLGDPGFDPGETDPLMGPFPTVMVDTPEGPMDYGAAVRAGYDPRNNFGVPEGNKNFKYPEQGMGGNIRTGDFRDSNNNGIDDRDEQPMGGSDYFDYMKYISRPKQAAAELAATAPEGEFPAYINAEEAELLKMYGGSGTTSNNPAEIPSFMGHHGGGGGSSTGTGSGNGNGNSGDGGNGNNNNNNNNSSSSAPTGRPSMADIAGGYNTPSGEKPGPGNPDRDTGASNVEDAQARAKELTEKQKQRNRDIIDAGATVTGAGEAMVDKEGGLIAAGRALDAFRAQREREQTAQAMIDQTQELANLGLSRDAAYAATGMPTAIGLQDASYDSFTDRQQELQDKAKANTITNSELQELASFNEFAGENPTTGMGIVESLRYQATRPDLGEDLAGLGNVLGLISGNPIKMGISALKLYNSTKPEEYNTVERREALAKKKKGFAGTIGDVYKGLTSATKLSAVLGSNAPLGIKALFGGVNALKLNDALYGLSSGDMGYDTKGMFGNPINAAKDKFKGLFGGQDDGNKQYANLPDNYGGGGFGNDRGNNDRDPYIYTENEKTEEEKQKEKDIFERAFAQRYFIGPADLPEVRKYAVTGGGYNQLTPYGIG